MSQDFTGKTVLITGAASGFGRLAAKMFVAAGAFVVLGDIQKEPLDTILAELGEKAAGLVTDVRKADAHKALVALAVERTGRLDAALNNAGIGHFRAKVADMDPAVMQRVFDVNVMGVFHGMQAQLAVMLKQGSGAIVNTSSVAGIGGAPSLGAYSASKHAVIGLTKTAAAEVARRGIRVNAICPGYSETPMLEGAIENVGGTHEEALQRLIAGIPMHRAGTAAEVVEVMMFLASPANGFMTGNAIAVDGGLTAL